MKDNLWTFGRWLGRGLRRYFLTGLIAMIPIGITVGILAWVFTTIDNILKPVITPIWGHPVPGIGFGITILLIFLVGIIASNVVGKRVISYGESLLSKVPLVRPLYAGTKQLLESFSIPQKGGFIQTVLVEFPRKDIWTIGFITNESVTQSGETQLNIFIPTAPNPTSGFLQIVKEEEVIRTDIPIDGALKMIVSAGKVSPQEVSDKLSGKANNSQRLP